MKISAIHFQSYRDASATTPSVARERTALDNSTSHFIFLLQSSNVAHEILCFGENARPTVPLSVAIAI